MERFEQREQPKISSLAEVPAIEKSRNQMILTRNQLKEFIEQPLLNACEIFWDKNIQTLETSANQKDIESGSVYIRINFDNLSKENQEIGQQYGSLHDDLGQKVLEISIPVSELTTTNEVSKKAMEIAGTFQKQKATWIPKITLQDKLDYFKKRFGDKYPEAVAQENERLSKPGAWEKECKKEGYYFDPKTQVAYLSEEHYQKANEEINDE